MTASPADPGRYRTLVDDWDRFRDTLATPLPATVWAHPGRITAGELARLLAEAGLAARPLDWHPGALRLAAGLSAGGHWGLAAGLYQIQEEAAMLPVRLLDPRPGERILDLCAAPGNKTAQIALAMGTAGTVVANDPQRDRLAALRLTVKRLGLFNVVTTRRAGEEYPLAAGPFDRILVDAPCSGEGTWRRGRGWPAGIAAGFRERLAQRQRRLLERAVRLCRPGGRIVYSTCTFAPEENEMVVEQLLRDHADRVSLAPARVTGFPSDPGITRWAGSDLDPRLRDTLRVWPHRADTGGFFAAVLECHGGTEVEPERHPAPEAVDAETPEWLARLLDLPGGTLEGLRAVERTGRYVYLAGEGLRPGERPPPESMGLPALGYQMSPPKPTTAAALAFGRDSRGAVVDLCEADLAMYRQRQTVRLSGGRPQPAPGGYVVVRHRGHPVGLGRLCGGRVESLYPKAWSG